MKSKEVIEFFGGATATGAALGITAQAVCQWGDSVPKSRQAHVEPATKGKIKRDKPVCGVAK